MPFDTSVPAVEQIIVVLERVAANEGLFANPFEREVAWHCTRAGLLAYPATKFRDSADVTAATIAPGYGAWDWTDKLTNKGREYLARGGPLLPNVTPIDEDTPERIAARERAVERARAIEAGAS